MRKAKKQYEDLRDTLRWKVGNSEAEMKKSWGLEEQFKNQDLPPSRKKEA